VIPFLSIVTGSGVRIPRIDLGPVIRRLCENYWKDAGGSQERLNLRLETLFLSLDRIRLLGEAVRALLVGGLSPRFSPRHGAIGVHLWSVDRPEKFANLLIADDATELREEPCAPSITAARRTKACADKTGPA
jgi:hypothetical protein